MTVLPEHRASLRHGLLLVAGCALLLAAVAFVPALHFSIPRAPNAALHAAMETGSVIVSLLVFSVGWASVRRGSAAGAAPQVSAVFLAVALLDFVHTFFYDGMPLIVEPQNWGTSVTLFLAARLLVALAMLFFAFGPERGVEAPAPYLPLVGGTLAFALVVVAVSIWEPHIPTLWFVPGQGLTSAKVGTEYVVVAMNLAAAAGFARRLSQPGGTLPVAQLLTATLVMALSEYAFTLYSTMWDQYSNFAHLLKIVAYAVIWEALFARALLRPYQALEAAQERLAASEERYRLLFENNLDAVFVASAAGRILDVNPAGCEALRASRDLLVGQPAEGLIDSQRPEVQRLQDEVARIGRGRATTRVRRPDGSLLAMEVAGSAWRDRKGRTLVSWVARDITERERARAEILQLNATLEDRVQQRTAQLEAVNRELEAFSYTVAHDLRAPLAAISAFGEVLVHQAGGRLQERDLQYIGRMRAAAAQMSGMIEALLELARLSQAKVSSVSLDLAAIADEILQECRDGAPRRQVETVVQRPLMARADPTLLRLALRNLLGNAWKFTGRCDKARIEVGSHEDAQGHTVFHVRDNGAGFDMAAAKRLFAPFQRMHPQAEFAGHGIGLANVSRIIALHGGRVWAESEPGKGTTFYFTLGLGRSQAVAA